jgi:hypothetical protein
MDTMLSKIKHLVDSGKVRISEHGYDELANDVIFVGEILSGIPSAVVVEEYPDYKKGPCILVLERDSHDRPIHVVWGIPKGQVEPAVLVTAYRPDPAIWESDFVNRRHQ